MLVIHLLLLCIICCGNSSAAKKEDEFLGTVPEDLALDCEVADVVLLVDKVREIGKDMLETERQLVSSMILQLPISPNKTRVAILSYSKGTKWELTLDQPQTVDVALSAAAGIRFGPGTDRYTHRAINKARSHLQDYGRVGVHHSIVYITAGQAAKLDKALKFADKAREEGITLFAVGMGSDVDGSELSQLAYKNQVPFVIEKLEGTNFFMSNLAM